ncbi:hypothetical protein DFP72DRAFT_826380 [Ephemerocybe angulata]|uniref:Uncharacterized protein n=1 Tax=Ephemerocybe angulata TaxID=980116 RepID=A0A8H6HDB9_9AGAR|nr:hypothetical protein DFP72DRAFT_826380 [Tulosesus angulatus]
MSKHDERHNHLRESPQTRLFDNSERRRIPQVSSPGIQPRFPELKALLTVRVGSLHLVQTGLLDGKRAATNKYALKLTLNVSWVKDARFVVDGKIWTAAGVTAGLDLAAEFARVTFDPEVNKLASELFEYQAKPARPDPFKYLLDGVKLD